MSKEQTPMESLIIDLKIMARIPDNYTLPMIIEMIESEYLPKEKEHTESKVLEALERVTEEEIELKIDSIPYYGTCTTEYKEGFRDGIEWYKEQTKQK